MQQNLVLIEQLNSGPVLLGIGTISLRTETWQAARVKLAQGLPGEDFGTIFEYYALVQDCIDNLRNMIRYWNNTQEVLDQLQAFREGNLSVEDLATGGRGQDKLAAMGVQQLDALLRRIPAKSVAAEKVVQEYLNREGSLARRR